MSNESTEAQAAESAIETVDTRSLPEYDEGRRSFTDGDPSDANPYPSGDRHGHKRLAWFHGWYDTRRIAKYGE